MKYEKFISYLQLESEKSIMEFEMLSAGIDGTKKEDDSSDDDETLYKNEFRLYKAKKLEEVPEAASLSFKIDEDDNFYVNIEQAFTI
jgi:hypothetical protein